MTLKEWGLETTFDVPAGLVLARVIEEQRTNYRLITEDGILVGQLAGKLLRSTIERMDRPTIGDWVAVKPLWSEAKAVIQMVLPRKSLLHRKAAGDEPYSQALAANVDLVFVVTSLNRDFNEKRLDRYFAIIHDSGAKAVLLLTKNDLEPGSDEMAKKMTEKYGIPCLSMSSITGNGIDAVTSLLKKGETSVFVGSSGVGKSTLVNALLGREEQTVGEVRESDDRGRHTTTFRRLIPVPSGALVIDTPGMREIQLDSAHATALESFSQVDDLAKNCKFTNCNHDSEPGCAVKKALEEGVLDAATLESFSKLRRELAFQDRKVNKEAASKEKQKWKSISKASKSLKK